MGVDVVALAETKLTHERHTTFHFGYSVCASQAWSSSQGGITLVLTGSTTALTCLSFNVGGQMWSQS